MIFELDNYSLDLKLKFKKIRQIIDAAIITCAISSMVYFIYWIFLICDDMVYSYTSQYFSPLANFLFPNGEGFEIYKNTSITLFALILPLFFSYFYCDKKEEKLLKYHDKLIEENKHREEVKAKLDYLRQFDAIKQYSICLSIDYKGQKEIGEDFKRKLNSIVFLNLEQRLFKFRHRVKMSLSDCLVIISNDFLGYDAVYDTLLHYLAKIRKITLEKYNLTITPSITTEAFEKNTQISDIKKRHYDIQSCNFKNQACSTTLFTKKYAHINKNKYAGVPIGEYAVFNDNKTNTYELNVIYKNLESALMKM